MLDHTSVCPPRASVARVLSDFGREESPRDPPRPGREKTKNRKRRKARHEERDDRGNQKNQKEQREKRNSHTYAQPESERVREREKRKD